MTRISMPIHLLLLAPAIAVLGVLFLGGLLFGLGQSLGLFSVVDVGGPTMEYYERALGSPDFAQSLLLTAYIAAVATMLASVVGLALALLLRGALRSSSVLRFLVQLPLPVPHLAAAVGVALLLGQSGLLARLLQTLGFIVAPAEMLPLVQDRYAIGIIVTYAWKEAPFIALITLAALIAVGDELERAARSLGATRWQTFIHVTLPLIAPAVAGAAMIVFVFVFGAFEVPLLLGRSYPRVLAVEALMRYQDMDLAVRPVALAINTLLAMFTALASLPYAWLLRHLVSARTRNIGAGRYEI